MAQKLQIGLNGLNADIPPYSLPVNYWNAGLNMRPKDGSIQAVPQGIELYYPGTTNDVFPVIDADTPQEINEIKMLKYNPDGFAYADILVAGVNINGFGRIRFSTNYDGSGGSSVVDVGRPRFSGGVWLEWLYDYNYGIDMFVLNQIAVVNPKGAVNNNGASTAPLYFNANDKTQMNMEPLYKTPQGTCDPNRWIFTNLVQLPGLARYTSNSGGESILTFTTAPSQAQLTPGDVINSKVDGTGTNYLVYRVTGNSVTILDPTTQAAKDFLANSPVYAQYPFSARYLTTFGGRMIALNLELIRGGVVQEYSPIEFAWSNPITELQSFNSISWVASATNTAGSDFLTETSGEVLAAVPLGDYLINYKSDQVYKANDTGAPNYFINQPLYTDDGIIGPYAVVEVNQSRHFFVGNNGIWMHQGGIDKQNISRGFVEEFFYRGDQGVDLNYKNLTFCYHNQLEKEVWICYRSKDAYQPGSWKDSGIAVTFPTIGPVTTVLNIFGDKRSSFKVGQQIGFLEIGDFPSTTIQSITYNGTYTQITAPTVPRLSWNVGSEIYYYSPTGFGIGDVPGCNYALCYNYETKVWYWRSLGKEIMNAGVVSNANYITDIKDILTNSQTYTLACAPSSNFTDIQTPNGLWYFPHVTPTAIGIYETNGYVQFDSRDIGTASIVKNCNGVYPHSSQPINMQLRFSNNIVDPTAVDRALVRRFDPVNLQYQNYRLDYRETGRYMHLKLSLAGTTNDGSISVQNPAANPYFTDMDIDMENRGRR